MNNVSMQEMIEFYMLGGMSYEEAVDHIERVVVGESND